MSWSASVVSLFTRQASRCHRRFSSTVDNYLAQFVNHEARGVPAGAGTESKHGFDLDRMHALLDALGRPQAQLRVAHISGTKGKGSTAAMLTTIMRAAGYTVGTYTSPHVVSLHERICVGGAPISEAQLARLVEAHSPAVAAVAASHKALSHFEVLTGLALRHFADQKVELAVIETGLGGVRDATNVFTAEQLQVAVFTAIDLEHGAALGGTLQSVTEAKAGIMRAGRPVVVAHQAEPRVLHLLHHVATALGCPRYHEQAELRHLGYVHHGGRLREAVGIFVTNGEQEHEQEVLMRLVGRHQHRNAEAAVTAALVLRQNGYGRVSIDAISDGLSEAHLPARFEVERLKSSSPEGGPWLVLDGAHTPASAAALACTLRSAFPELPLALVVAMADDKEAGAIMAALRLARPEVAVFTTAPITGSTQRCMSSGKLLAQWQAASMGRAPGSLPQRTRELMSPTVAAAVARAQQQLAPHGSRAVICVTGSLHAAAAALSAGLVETFEAPAEI